jgi:hypothetical protein
LATLVSASATVKYAVASTAGGKRSSAGRRLDRHGAARRQRADAPRRPRSVRTAGWMPRRSSRSSCDASCSSSPSRSRNAPTSRRVLGQPPLATWTSRTSDTEPLLRAVVQVALDLAPRRVRGLDDARARGAQLGGAGRLDLVAQQLSSASRRSVMSNIAPSSHKPPAGPADELAAVEHPAHRRRRRARSGTRAGTAPSLSTEACVIASSTMSTSSGWTMLSSVRLRGQEVRGGIARDALDLVADHLQR